ncbi:Peptide synthetase [Acidisarcina polymorpha]|uniref:Peptide synthetase n=2 Tax=Acidisarcina polymorpha TaxID=2211140 RepID=A0A2Z5G0K1_9BACT|nr:Peptide synthetase [Acidisarcina polymorpha]
MVIGLLAILKAGGAYVPLDPASPMERLAFMIEDSVPLAVLTQQSVLPAFGRLPETLLVVNLEEDAGFWGSQSMKNPDPATLGLTSRHLAYVIYTSGSTGKPKGVVVEHRNITNYLFWTLSAYFQEKGSGSPAIHSIGFDGLVTTFYGPILCGQRLTLLSPGSEMTSIAQFGSSEHAPYTMVKVTPSHLKLLNRAFSSNDKNAPTRILMIGGEALVPADLLFWQQRFPEVRMVNHFGPTETTVGCCTFDIVEPLDGSSSIPIGRPISNMRIYILDECGEPVPIGAIGEIYVSGAGVARGYWNRQELTEERFLDDPFAAEVGVRMYRTGDLGRYRDDGNIEFLGRNDFQVKIRGFRIELGEIEACLAQHPSVGDAVVLAREDIPGDKRLVAYYTSADPKEPSIGARLLRAHLSGKLPDYMVPAAYVELNALPLTVNGKLDRTALSAPETKAYSVGCYEAPIGQVEETLARLWGETLEIEQVGRNDDFFELGGHSLLATRLVGQVANVFGVQINVEALLLAPTIRELAVRVTTGDESPDPWGIVPIQPFGDKTPIIAINHPMMYQKLSRSIGTDRPFLAVQVFDPYNPQALPSLSLEEIAGEYVRLIRMAIPSGPYMLIGLCNAGLLAYETARLLRQAGQPVPLVVMADTWCPGHRVCLTIVQRILRKRMNLSIKLRHHWRQLRLVRTAKLRLEEYLAQTRVFKWTRFLKLLSQLRLLEDPSAPIEINSRGAWFLPALRNACANYQVPATTDDVVLLVSETVPNAHFVNPTLGWSNFVKGKLSHYRLPEFHNYMFKNNATVAQIAEHLEPLLKQVDLNISQLGDSADRKGRQDRRKVAEHHGKDGRTVRPLQHR